MVKLGCSFSGKPGKDPGGQDGVATDSVPLISPLDVSQLQPPFADQVAIKMQTEYQLCSATKALSDLEAQKLNCGHPEEARKQMPTARMVAFAMALLGCVLVMYKAIWYDQLTCPDGFLLRQHKICTPLTLEMYYTELDPERHRSILAAIGAYPLGRKHGAGMPSARGPRARAAKEGPKAPPTPAGAAATEPPGKPEAEEDPAAGSPPPPTPQ